MKTNNNVHVPWIDFIYIDIKKLQRSKYHELYDENVSSDWTPILHVFIDM